MDTNRTSRNRTKLYQNAKQSPGPSLWVLISDTNSIQHGYKSSLKTRALNIGICILDSSDRPEAWTVINTTYYDTSVLVLSEAFWFSFQNRCNISTSTENKNSKQLRMIFSNCAVVKMTSGIYFTNHGSVNSSDPNGLDQGNVSVWQNLILATSKYGGIALPCHPHHVPFHHDDIQRIHWFDVVWRQRDNEWWQGIGGIAVRRHPVGPCVLSATFVLFVWSKISCLIASITSHFGTIKRGVVKDCFGLHLPSGNKVRGTKPTKKLGIIMVVLFCLFVGCHGKQEATELTAGKKVNLSTSTVPEIRMFKIKVPQSYKITCHTATAISEISSLCMSSLVPSLLNSHMMLLALVPLVLM